MTKRTFWIAAGISASLHLAPVFVVVLWAAISMESLPTLLQPRGNADQEGTPFGVLSLTPGSYYSDPDLPSGKEQQPGDQDRQLPATASDTDLSPQAPADPAKPDELVKQEPPSTPAPPQPEPEPVSTQAPMEHPETPEPEPSPIPEKPPTNPEPVREPEPTPGNDPIPPAKTNVPRKEPKPASEPAKANPPSEAQAPRWFSPPPNPHASNAPTAVSKKTGQGNNPLVRTKALSQKPGKGKGTLSSGSKASGGHETSNMIGGSPLPPGIPPPGGKPGVPDGLEFLSRPPKIYPQEAKDRRWEGEALVGIVISDKGYVVMARIHRTSGHLILDNAAVKYARGLRFLPARRLGFAVSATVILPVEYKLIFE